MAQRLQAESASSAQPGAILVVIHDFVARSSDELSLSKGDRVELIERDDDFGDGWYLGRHLQSEHTGLFPEVYTKTAPKGTLTAGQSRRQSNTRTMNPIVTAAQRASTISSSMTSPGQTTPLSAPATTHEPSIQITPSQQSSPTLATSVSSVAHSPAIPSQSSPGNNLYPVNSTGRTSNTSSTVMNETLSVIDEHITDMRKPGRSRSPRPRRMTTDSASEYSMTVPSEHRLSYIQGSETEEEESTRHTAREVKRWTPARVAQYLESVGVEKGHCDVFREQEFSGEVLLGMDQSSIFLKELDLGPIGRRLKTWQKIRALQDEVSPPRQSQTRKVSESSRPESRRASNSSSTLLHRPSQSIDKSTQDQAEGGSNQQQQQQPAQPQSSQLGRQESTAGSTLTMISASARHSPRPSAASIRSLGHSRRQSSLDQPLTSTTSPPTTAPSGHSKQPSFDRNWSMNNFANQVNGASRPVSSAHGYSLSSDRPQFEKRSSQLNLSSTTAGTDVDRGYVSGSEADTRSSRRVLRKRDAEHGRTPSFETGKRLSFFRRASRASSVGRTPDISGPSSAVHVATGSETNHDIGGKSVPPSEASAPPSVTNLGDDELSSRTKMTDGKVETPAKSPRKGLRAISDAVTGREKAATAHWDNVSPTVEMSTPHSPSSGTPSGASKSIDLEDANSSKYSTPVGPPVGPRRKTKKETSAYTRGLLPKAPQDQIAQCDYSGWMKKKSSNLVTNWKPRLFVLKGKRLSYYYSENDKQERGLIDITGHRVLAADRERLTGIHAAITKATSSPTSPQLMHSGTFSSTASASPTKEEKSHSDVNTPTSATENSSVPNTPSDLAPDGQGFIFKLVPPRVGMSKAVNFTKPTVHYFAVPSREIGRLWMAALMKATIDKDENVVTTYQQKTISLEKARARNERPPALQEEEGQTVGGTSEADSQLEKVDEATDAEKAEEAAEEAQKKSEEEPIGQMRAVTDLSPVVDPASISPQHEKKASKGSGKRSGSGDGLGIKGLNGASSAGGPILNQMHKAGLW